MPHDQNKAPRVLLVEDDEDLRETLCEVLEDRGYRPTRASNGEEALKLLRANGAKPSVILLDLMMPVMNGWQFLGERENDPALRRIPVIVLTAHGAELLTDQKVDGVLRKPVSLDALLSALEQLCPIAG
jgi:CheY-like chemotaxis protein